MTDKVTRRWCKDNLMIVSSERLFNVTDCFIDGEKGFVASALVDIFDKIKKEKLYTVDKKDGGIKVFIVLAKPRNDLNSWQNLEKSKSESVSRSKDFQDL